MNFESNHLAHGLSITDNQLWIIDTLKTPKEGPGKNQSMILFSEGEILTTFQP